VVQLRPKHVETGAVARALGVTAKTVSRWCASNQIEGAYRVGRGHWRIPAEYLSGLSCEQAKAEMGDFDDEK
jgi:excisionase family DNA binding protein